MAKFILCLWALFGLSMALMPLQPNIIEQIPTQGDVGDPLYLTEYIERGDIDGARQASLVTATLDGLSSSTQPESYSGFFTVNANTDSNMYFWFIPATDIDPADAPVVIWLQGGPGSSSLFGMLELHGPFLAVDNSNGDVEAVPNEFAWSKRANMLYIDNPVGAGFSYADRDALPEDQDQVGTDLYECLTQFFTVFTEYQSNEFYAFGESYAGKFVPTIARRIHEENEAGAEIQINLAGIGLGDGFTDPPNSAVYAEYLYQVDLVDENTRDELLDDEQNMKDACDAGNWDAAFNAWNFEFNDFLSAMGCPYYYEIRQCFNDPEEDNYATFVQLDSTREAIHVGSRPFGSQSGAVYSAMRQDFMQSGRANLEFLLDRYRVLIYDGNMDIICNHSGVLKMFDAMQDWEDIDTYHAAGRQIFRVNGETAGYLTSAGNLRMIVMRNAGHMVPRSQPENALEMFNLFIDNDL